ncbi:hypothetical protein L7F22_022627 [Adiantum nelumboides]|nr:hypothetical protein [Adiantum nelumboides]
MYGKCGATFEAEHLFQAMSSRTVVSWNALLSAYVEQGHGDRALQLHTQMQKEGVCSDQLTCVITLQACSSLAEKGTALENKSTRIRSMDFDHALHADALKKGFTSDVIIANTLVSMYGKCGCSRQAKFIFDMIPERTVVSWNVMLAAYLEQGQGEEILELYRLMKNQGLILDHITPICVLQACGLVGSLESCEKIHFDIVSGGYDYYSSLNAPLIHAYGSCASMEQAQDSFDKIVKPDLTSWNACIAGYTGEGNHVASFCMFEELKLAGVKPDEVTCTSMLSACSHSGLPLESLEYFESMDRDYDLMPDLMHFGSMLDLLGRAGDFKKLESMLNRMPAHADLGIWLCLLGACCTHGNLDIAKLAFDHAVTLEPKQSTLYVLMSNIFANLRRFEKLCDEEVYERQLDSFVDESWSNSCASAC